MSKLNLSTRFTLILSGVFLVGIAIGGTAYWRALQGRAQDEITTQGTLLIETMNAVRGYTSNNVRPLLADKIADSPQFISETVPAFSARSVFENFRGQLNFSTYLYKEAAINPTNPVDIADEFEADLLNQFYSDESSAEVSGYRDLNGENLFYIARPLKIGSESCLECHSTPENAPTSLIATYGDEGGFGWELNEVIAVQIIYVPAEEVFNSALQTFTLVMGIFLITFAIVILLINFLLRNYVIQPVNVLSGLANKISADENFSTELESTALHSITNRPDELGNLAQVFKKMAVDVYERTVKLKEQVKDLIIKIDQIRRQEQVSEITDTDFFNTLQQRAKEMRNKGKSDETK
ncbi:MAG TPA: histidine kinase [Anaerolineae bacterium]|nr:histidine kinase [Anaerolineae bacterium]